MSDLNKKVIEARSAPQDRGIDGIRDLLFQLPGGEGQSLSRDMDNVSNIRASTQDPMNMSPQELHAVLWQVLKFRDDVSKAIERTIEKVRTHRCRIAPCIGAAIPRPLTLPCYPDGCRSPV